MDNLKKFITSLEQGITALALSQAILEDYCAVISKIENVPFETVRARIMKATAENFENLKPKLHID